MAPSSLRRATRAARKKLFGHSETALAPEPAPKTETSPAASSSSTLLNSPERNGSGETPAGPSEGHNQDTTAQNLSTIEPNNQTTMPPSPASDLPHQPSSSLKPRSLTSDGQEDHELHHQGTTSQRLSHVELNNDITMLAFDPPHRSLSLTPSNASLEQLLKFSGKYREENALVAPTAPASTSANVSVPLSFANPPPLLPASAWTFTPSPASSSGNQHGPPLGNSSANESSLPSVTIKPPTPPPASGPADAPSRASSSANPQVPSLARNSAKATPPPPSSANQTALSSASSSANVRGPSPSANPAVPPPVFNSANTPAPTSSANVLASPKNVDFAGPSSPLHKIRRYSEAFPPSSVRNAPEKDKLSASGSKTDKPNSILKPQPQEMQAQADSNSPKVYVVILSTARANHIGTWDQILHKIQGVYQGEQDADNKVISMYNVAVSDPRYQITFRAKGQGSPFYYWETSNMVDGGHMRVWVERWGVKAESNEPKAVRKIRGMLNP
jgi:hypothetical protein